MILGRSTPYSIRYMDYDNPSSYKVVETAKKRPSFNPLKPKDPYMGRTAPLTSKFCIL